MSFFGFSLCLIGLLILEIISLSLTGILNCMLLNSSSLYSLYFYFHLADALFFGLLCSCYLYDAMHLYKKWPPFGGHLSFS